MTFLRCGAVASALALACFGFPLCLRLPPPLSRHLSRPFSWSQAQSMSPGSSGGTLDIGVPAATSSRGPTPVTPIIPAEVTSPHSRCSASGVTKARNAEKRCPLRRNMSPAFASHMAVPPLFSVCHAAGPVFDAVAVAVRPNRHATKLCATGRHSDDGQPRDRRLVDIAKVRCSGNTPLNVLSPTTLWPPFISLWCCCLRCLHARPRA